MGSWKRTFWAVWFANFVAAAGMQSFLPFFPSHVESLGVTDRDQVALWSGLIFGAAPLSAAFLTPIWGALGDRFGRRLMVMRALFGLSLFVGLMALATSPLHLFLLRLGQGVFSGFMAPSITMVSFASPPGKQGRITGSLQVGVALGAMAGPLIGAQFGRAVGMQSIFLGVSAAAFVGGLVILFFAREPDALQRIETGEKGVAGVLRGTLGDLRAVMANPALRTTVLLLFVLQFAFGTTKPQLELFVRDVVGVAEPMGVSAPLESLGSTETGALSSSPSEGAPSGPDPVRITGMLAALMALAHTVSLRAWGSWGDERGHGRALLACSLLAACALALHSLAASVVVLVVLQLALGIGMAGASPSSYGLAGDVVSEDRRGGAFGVLFGARTLAMATSASAGGWLAGHVGLRALFLGSGLAVLGALFVLRPRRVPERAPEPDPTPPGFQDREGDAAESRARVVKSP